MTAADIGTIQALLDAVPPPLEPLDASSLDGFLCGVLLQPNTIDAQQWLRYVTDVEGRALPRGHSTARLHGLVRRRADEIRSAIRQRQWFDPWIFELEGSDRPTESALPWVAGFAAAMELFPALLRLDDERLLEPLALLYLHFDVDDLEDADALRVLIDTLEPPADLAEAVQDIVRSLMLMADVVDSAATSAGRPGPRGR